MKILRTIKNLWWVALLMLSLPEARAFSLAGPVANGGDAWQFQNIGYGPPSDDVAPKNLGEEYRRNTPILYYTYDQNFIDYFDTNGMTDIDGAVAIFNALTNVDQYSQALSEFPLETRNQNGEASALGLFNLKSYALATIVRQMGLAGSVEYTWTLHDRWHLDGAPACPGGMEYFVVQRNFDPMGYPVAGSSTIFTPYSPMVNGVLYDYQILEFCSGVTVLAVANPTTVDHEAYESSPLSERAIDWGDYYSGLTRDDVAGLKYLLSTNNVNWETPAGNVVLTNLELSIPLTTSNLSELLLTAQTNSPAAGGTFGSLNGEFFPNITVVSFSNYWTTVTNWQFGSYLYQPPKSPYGTQVLVVYSNIVSIVPQENFMDVFGNIITNNNLTNFPGLINGRTISLGYSPNTKSLLVTTSLGTKNGDPYPAPIITNTTTKLITITNQASGEYFTMPVGDCGVEIEYPQPSGYPIPNVVATTNVIASATNDDGFIGSESIVTYFTNHTYIVYPITCSNSPPTPALYQGIGDIKFVRADYDSLIGQFWQPVTNNYSMVGVTNGHTITLQFQRIVTQPDFLFSAQDLATGESDDPHGNFISRITVPPFFEGNVLPNLAGPGTITPTTTISFNKVGPLFFNYFGGPMVGDTYFTNSPGEDSDSLDSYYSEYFLWASFDGTTNAPIVYPTGTSIDDLTQIILTQILPTTLPIIVGGTTYTNIATFTASGGGFTGPFTWSATGLPAGLSITSGGTLYGTPTQSGISNFTLILTDSLGRSGQWLYTITIQ